MSRARSAASSPTTTPVADGLRAPVLALLVAVAVVVPYAQLGGARFINFDDPSYVTENPWVLQGLTAASLRWALTATEMANWNPLTWLSHLLDVQLFGMHAGAHHLTSVALHVVNTLLLFAVLRRFGGGDGCAALVALLFGLHPLHVESVAWISERKDVLSTTFLFLALWAYLAYAARPSAGRYVAVALAYALGLMAKPMLVTFPFLLLLLDVWPLRRLTVDGDARANHATAGDPSMSARLTWLVVEKLPLFAMTAAMSLLTLATQRGAMVSTAEYPFARRAANAVVSYGVYLRKASWPFDLAVFYPYPAARPAWTVALSALVLVAISAAVLWKRDRPYLMIGWLWFVGMLVPVSGLVQVGDKALADRYTYVPLVGVFIMLVWGGAELAARWQIPPRWRRGVVAAVIGGCLVASTVQASYWRDSATLFRHALAVTDGNYMAYLQIGAQYGADGDVARAAEYYEAALRMKPDYAEAHNNLGLILANRGDASEAFAHYEAALRADPFYADAHYNRGLLLQQTGRLDEAADEYRHALALRPSYAEAHSNLGVILFGRGDLTAARAELGDALRLRPSHVGAHVNLGAVLRAGGDLDGAIAQYRIAIALDPRSTEAHSNLGNVLAQRGDLDGAIVEWREALRTKPDYAPAQDMLRQALERRR